MACERKDFSPKLTAKNLSATADRNSAEPWMNTDKHGCNYVFIEMISWGISTPWICGFFTGSRGYLMLVRQENPLFFHRIEAMQFCRDCE